MDMGEAASTGRAGPSLEPQRKRIKHRTQLACLYCKEKKLKCDYHIPACANCHRHGMVCLVEDPVTKRHQPRNYLESLEQRVAYLETMLHQLQPSSSNADFLNAPPPCPDIQLDISSQTSGDYIPQISFEADDQLDGLNELASKVGALSLNAAGGEPHYLGSSSTFAFSRVISSSLRQLVLTNANSYTHPNEARSSMPVPCSLPNYEDAVLLSGAYFNNIHPQYPFLHEPTFKNWEAALSVTAEAASSTASDVHQLFFLNMVYAVGALLLPKLGYSPERFYVSAQLYADHILPLENLESVQAILCCAVYSLRSSTGTSHWKLAGLALRQCIDLGYHRNSKRLKLTNHSLQSELQKRAFWCAYCMECAAAVMLGRPICIPDQEVDAEYPADIDDWCITSGGISFAPRSSANELVTSTTRAIHGFRLRRLWGRIHTSLYSDTALRGLPNEFHISIIQHLRAELDEWQTSIPPAPTVADEALSLFTTSDGFDLDYNYAILLLYRGQIINYAHQPPNDVFAECMRAAANICHGYRRQFIGKPTTYTWGALHELFLAGLTYIHCLWTSPGARSATPHEEVIGVCTDCTIVLVVMAESWKAAVAYRDIFETLSSRTMAMTANQNNSEPVNFGDVEQPFASQEGDLGRWKKIIAEVGMSTSVDSVLDSLISDSPVQQEDFNS